MGDEPASEPPEEQAQKVHDRRDEREFLHDPKRAAVAITKAKKRLDRPSAPREPGPSDD